MMQPQERDLAVQARNGDCASFGALVRSHEGRLRAFAARFLANSEDVHDIVQDAFLVSFRNLDRFDERKEFWPWVRTICRNLIRDHFRKRRRNAGVALLDSTIEDWAAARPDDSEESLQRIQALRECIDRLQPRQRELLTLRYHLHVRVAEIANRLKRSAASVSVALMRIRSTLQRCTVQRLGAARS